MTTVLIAKSNKEVFESFSKRIKFKEASLNTCTFTTSKFRDLYNYIKGLGYNPFSLMYWY